jgi:PadR family transcriptional regulator, regulatory protein PadR
VVLAGHGLGADARASCIRHVISLRALERRGTPVVAPHRVSNRPLDILGEGLYPSTRMSTHNEKERVEFLQGTLDMLVLRTLILGPAHGHAIAHAIERNSDDVLQVEQGSLYPALHRLIRRGWIQAEEGLSENNRRAKFYRLTAKGRKQLAIENTRWEKFAGAIARIMRPAPQEGDL